MATVGEETLQGSLRQPTGTYGVLDRGSSTRDCMRRVCLAGRLSGPPSGARARSVQR